MKKPFNLSDKLRELEPGQSFNLPFKNEGKVVKEKPTRSTASANKCSCKIDYDEQVFIITKKQTNE